MSEETTSQSEPRPDENGSSRRAKTFADQATDHLQLLKNTAAYCFGIQANQPARSLDMALAETIACTLHPTKASPLLDVIIEASRQGATEAQISKAIGRLQPAPGQGVAPVITFERHGKNVCVRLTSIGRWLCHFVEGGSR